ncbi:MAG: hypothetical protein JWN04_4313 [Myxococcaceae bacterium]|nr:hypothetical protein [Myxococcaceae bacterium]
MNLRVTARSVREALGAAGLGLIFLALVGCSDDSSKQSDAPSGAVCDTTSTTGVARGTRGAAFTKSDLEAYCAWESGCWSPQPDSTAQLQSCTVSAVFLPSKQECLAERDACLHEPDSVRNGGTCDSAALSDVKSSCPQSVEELESCSREVLRATAQLFATASCDQAGQTSSPWRSLSSGCAQMFATCAIWGA